MKTLLVKLLDSPWKLGGGEKKNFKFQVLPSLLQIHGARRGIKNETRRLECRMLISRDCRNGKRESCIEFKKEIYAGFYNSS